MRGKAAEGGEVNTERAKVVGNEGGG